MIPVQAHQEALYRVLVVPRLTGNLFDTDLVTAAEIGVRICHAVQVDVLILRGEVIHDLGIIPEARTDKPSFRHICSPP